MRQATRQTDMYVKMKVESASPMGLIHMVYDEALKSLSEAKSCLLKRERLQYGKAIVHTQDCIRELRNCLKLELGEIAVSLYKLYTFMLDQLVEANLKREDPASLLSGVERQLFELKATWKQAEKIQQAEQKVEQYAESLCITG